MRVLFVSYDGILESLGASQVLAYLVELGRSHDITLLSFEKPEDLRDTARLQAARDRLAESAVRWVWRRYHKRPTLPATTYDVLVGIAAGLKLVRTRRVEIVHARGYVPSLIAIALKRATGTRYLFDMRGFWPDEKVDAGQWTKGGLLYRLAKWWERRFVEAADAIVSLTTAGLEALDGLGYRIRTEVSREVIPTCTDLSRFRPGPKDSALAARLGLDSRFVIGCVGTISNWYMRQAMLEYLAYFMEECPKFMALMVTQENHDRLQSDARAAGVPVERLRLARAHFSDMPDYIRLIDVGLFFIYPVFSKKGSAATKLGEFLGSGVPVIINDGVGDSGTIVREARVGVVLPDVGRESFKRSIAEVNELLSDPDAPTRCRQAAERWFDLRLGVARYDALYRRLGPRPVAAPP